GFHFRSAGRLVGGAGALRARKTQCLVWSAAAWAIGRAHVELPANPSGCRQGGSVRRCDGSEVGRPQNGTQAHATSRELEFVRPARVGATPFWDRPSSEPASGEHS